MDSIEARLDSWGKWARNHDRGGSISRPLWAKMVSNGGIRAFSPDFSVFPTEIEQTERAIAALRLKAPYLKKLVFHRYLYNLQPEEIGTVLDRPVSDIKAGLDRARDWIGDYLETVELIDESARLDRVEA